ncbi:hypothetical protein KKB40_04220 [Patescibacteria group bacterium]|nr:hypothetical protein [Patescibacteria group bacterium]
MKIKKLKRLLALLLLPIVIYGLIFIYQENKVNEIEAVDHLSITYDGSAPPVPIFVVENMLPGDCISKSVTVEHKGGKTVEIVVRSKNEEDDGNLSTQLGITVSENSDVLYGTTTVHNFFNESAPSGIPLSIFNGNETKTFEFNVCFDENASNDYQNTSTIFDLVFFEKLPPIEIPDECKDLEITSIIEGTEKNDRIIGTPANELILAYGGNDRVEGNSGDDCIVGGDGNDKKLDGGSGNDVIIGDGGNDKIDGGSGNDIIYAGDGNDKADGGSGEDIISGGNGNDRLEGGAGDDTISAGAGNDRIWGGSGEDTIMGDEGNDRIDGDSGNDVLYGGLGVDKIHGDAGDDYIYGDEGDDILWGDAGNDYLDGGGGFDKLKGDAGTDTCFGENVFTCEIFP